MPIVLKSGNLNLLEPSGSVQDCNGIDLPLPFIYYMHIITPPDGNCTALYHNWCIIIIIISSSSSSSSSSKKVKFTLEQAMKAQRGSRVIALLFLQVRR